METKKLIKAIGMLNKNGCVYNTKVKDNVLSSTDFENTLIIKNYNCNVNFELFTDEFLSVIKLGELNSFEIIRDYTEGTTRFSDSLSFASFDETCSQIRDQSSYGKFIELGQLHKNDFLFIKKGIDFLSKDIERVAAQNVCLRKGKILASNGSILLFEKSEEKLKKEILINKTVSNLLSLFNENVTVYENSERRYLKFVGQDFEIIQWLVDEVFPMVSDAIPSLKDLNKSIKISKKVLLNAIKELTPFLHKKNKGIIFSFKSKNELELKTYNPDIDDVKINLFSENTGESIEFSLNAKLLGIVLKSIDSDEITFNFIESRKSFIINETRLLMPILL